MVKYSNVLYFYNINSIGGVEQFFYYLGKGYNDYDITIFFQVGDLKQLRRLRKLVRVIKWHEGDKIKCDKCFLNYNSIGFIDCVEAEEFTQIIHCDYEAQHLVPVFDKRITRFIGVSKAVCESFTRLTGLECELAYNPVYVDEPIKPLILISATRLTEEKGKDNFIKLGKILNEKKVPYIWFIFTNDVNAIDNPNIKYMKPRLDITSYMSIADFLVQVSPTEAYGFAPVEMLTACKKPVIVIDLPVYSEIGINETNSIKLKPDFDDIDEELLYKKWEIDYTPPPDRWGELLKKSKSTYKKELKQKVKVKCIQNYTDIDTQDHITIDDEPFYVSSVRSTELVDAGVCEIYKGE